MLPALLLLSFLFIWKYFTVKPKNFPPGPSRFPFLGNVLDLKSPHSATPSVFWGVTQLQKKFGNIFGLYLGSMRTVVLTKYEDMKELLSHEEASSRPPTYPCEIREGWEHCYTSDPVLNYNRGPGVILSNVSIKKTRNNGDLFCFGARRILFTCV